MKSNHIKKRVKISLSFGKPEVRHGEVLTEKEEVSSCKQVNRMVSYVIHTPYRSVMYNNILVRQKRSANLP
jgi:hypothetical protein